MRPQKEEKREATVGVVVLFCGISYSAASDSCKGPCGSAVPRSARLQVRQRQAASGAAVRYQTVQRRAAPRHARGWTEHGDGKKSTAAAARKRVRSCYASASACAFERERGGPEVAAESASESETCSAPAAARIWVQRYARTVWERVTDSRRSRRRSVAVLSLEQRVCGSGARQHVREPEGST